MEGLQRSSSSYRRQGSSGLVWENNFSGDLNKLEGVEFKEIRSYQSVGSIRMLERSASTGGGGHGFRANKVLPDIDPPSPKAITCGLWQPFGKKPKSQKPKNSGKHKS